LSHVFINSPIAAAGLKEKMRRGRKRIRRKGEAIGRSLKTHSNDEGD